MTVRELKKILNDYDEDMDVVIAGERHDIHYELSDVDFGYDTDLETDVVILIS